LNHDRRQAEAEADQFIRQYYGHNWWGTRWGPFGTPEAVVDRIRAYAEAGVQHLIVRFAAFDQAAQMETFSRTVLPALRATP